MIHRVFDSTKAPPIACVECNKLPCGLHVWQHIHAAFRNPIIGSIHAVIGEPESGYTNALETWLYLCDSCCGTCNGEFE